MGLPITIEDSTGRTYRTTITVQALMRLIRAERQIIAQSLAILRRAGRLADTLHDTHTDLAQAQGALARYEGILRGDNT